MNNNIFSAISWANDYIKEYEKSHRAADFDPLAILSGTADRQTIIYINCVNFLAGLDTAAEHFRKVNNGGALL